MSSDIERDDPNYCDKFKTWRGYLLMSSPKKSIDIETKNKN